MTPSLLVLWYVVVAALGYGVATDGAWWPHGLEGLLVGRPSELARHAASLPPPPPPAELAFAASRDFRLVHFGGYTLVVVDVPPER